MVQIVCSQYIACTWEFLQMPLNPKPQTLNPKTLNPKPDQVATAHALDLHAQRKAPEGVNIGVMKIEHCIMIYLYIILHCIVYLQNTIFRYI